MESQAGIRLAHLLVCVVVSLPPNNELYCQGIEQFVYCITSGTCALEEESTATVVGESVANFSSIICTRIRG